MSSTSILDRERPRRPSEAVRASMQVGRSNAPAQSSGRERDGSISSSNANSSRSDGKSSSTLGDLTAAVRRTGGNVPPPLVGSSSTLVGSKIYVFGGRLVPTRTMIAKLWELDLGTLVWRQLWPKRKRSPSPPSEGMGEMEDENLDLDHWEMESEAEAEASAKGEEARGPQPRYFHSAEAWGSDRIVFFGGMGYGDPSTPNPKDTGKEKEAEKEEMEREREDGRKQSNAQQFQPPGLAVLNDLVVYHVHEKRWSFPHVSVDPITIMPSPRYAHLSVMTSILSPTRTTALSTPSPPSSSSSSTSTPVHSATGSSSKPAFANCLVIMGGQDITNRYVHEMNVLDLETMTWVQSMRWDRHCGAYRCVAVSAHVGMSNATEEDEFGVRLPTADKNGVTNEGGEGEDEDESFKIVRDKLPHSVLPTIDNPEPIFLYSNYNFSDVRREFELITTPLPQDFKPQVFQLSHRMVGGPTLPPGLRFPTGAIIGQYFIIAGTFLSHHFNSYAIWALDLGRLSHEDKTKGGGEEETAFPWQKVDPGGVLQNGSWNRSVFWRNSVVVLGDRERDIALDYDRRQSNFVHVAFIDLEAFGIYQPPFPPLPPIAQSFGLKALREPFLSDFEIVCCDGKSIGCSRSVLEDRWEWFRERMEDFRRRAGNIVSAQQRRVVMDDQETIDTTNSKETVLGGSSPIGDWRLSARSLHLPEPSNVVMALLQYFYSLALCTKLQLSLPVLSSLLIFSRVYGEKNLRKFVVHALHAKLGQSDTVAGVVYQVATLGSCMSLQIRALKMVYNAQKHGRIRARAGTVGEETRDQNHAHLHTNGNGNGNGAYRVRAATVGEGAEGRPAVA
ncbi:hypothetical protein BT69DRAFT_603994 [Atractiella rhizophila]|nr:hypothetical protein BT69DRAFT_603994 [Atractiella rhizophila]